MRYFTIKQNIPLVFENKVNGDKSCDVFYLSGDPEGTKPDFIEEPVMMMAGYLKKIVDLYQDGVGFENAVLIHHQRNLQFPYVKINIPSIDAISDLTEYYPNQMFKRLVFSRRKIGDHQFFMVSDRRIKHPIVSLSVAESLLRRKVKGIAFEEVEVADDEHR